MNFNIGSMYSFDTWPAAILGASFKGVTVMGVMTEQSAIKAGCRTRELHAQVYSQLPVGTPNNAGAYNYVQIQTSTGETAILGMAWIKEASVVEIVAKNYNVKVANISADAIPRLRNALLTSGFKEFEISLIE